MVKTPKEKGAIRPGVLVSFDPVTFDRLRLQAARRHGTTEGYIQDYLRAAAIKQLNQDEAEEAKAMEMKH